jgi:hypothetical protein
VFWVFDFLFLTHTTCDEGTTLQEFSIFVNVRINFRNL